MLWTRVTVAEGDAVPVRWRVSRSSDPGHAVAEPVAEPTRIRVVSATGWAAREGDPPVRGAAGRQRGGAYAASMSDFDAGEYGASGIAEDYDALYADHWETDAAVDCLVELADGGPVLELGIGTGRLALPMVRRGLDVQGIDGSPEMVAKLREKPGGEQLRVVIGDFADAVAGEGFSLVVLAVNTIFALPDQDAQVACFQNAARHLRPAGRFVVEAWVPDVGGFRSNRLLRPRVIRPDVVSIEAAELDQADQIMRTTQVVFAGGRVRLYPATHRYAWPAELDLMGRLAGFRRESRWADWTRSPFTADSTAHVTVYRT